MEKPEDKAEVLVDGTERWVRAGRPSPRIVVSVALSHEDWLLVSECAERLRKPVSAFIREAALDRATTPGRVSVTSCGEVRP